MFDNIKLNKVTIKPVFEPCSVTITMNDMGTLTTFVDTLLNSDDAVKFLPVLQVFTEYLPQLHLAMLSVKLNELYHTYSDKRDNRTGEDRIKATNHLVNSWLKFLRDRKCLTQFVTIGYTELLLETMDCEYDTYEIEFIADSYYNLFKEMYKYVGEYEKYLQTTSI
jgi:hypothetical protein